MAKQNIDMKTMMSNPLNVTSINEITKEKLQNFVKTLPQDEINQLKNYIKQRQPKNTNGIFMMARAYIYNKYVKPPMEVETKTEQFNLTKNKPLSFAEFLSNL